MRRFNRLAAAALVLATGCKSLDVQNPNAPDAQRAFADPGAVAGLVTGAFKGWINTRQEYNSALILDHMADSYTSSWNNFNIRYYTSYGADCANRCGWDNDPNSAFRFQIETFWYGFYSALSNVNDALTAIRKQNLVIGDAIKTKRTEFGAQMMQGMIFAQLALNYDQAFFADENTDLSSPEKVAALPLLPRAQLRDSAIKKFDGAIALAQATSITSEATWTGVNGGPQYSSAQLIQIINTMKAEVLAHFPRNAAENTAVDWAKVAQFAAAGISDAGSEFQFFADKGGIFYDGAKNWGNDVTTVRVQTRLAALITDGPDHSLRHVTPWPDPDGNPQPNAYDKRVGDGGYGPDDDFLGVGTVKATPNSGTDYAYASAAIFRPARGQYHQSNLGYIRYHYLASAGYGLPGEDGTGLAMLYNKTFNDLLLAEALIRTGGDLQTAADLINNTRVGRGQLAPVSAADGVAGLTTALNYEQQIELVGIGSAPYYNRRRSGSFAQDGLWPDTPRQMPVPAKELSILKLQLYTFGGAGKPDQAAPIDPSTGQRVKNVREEYAERESMSRAEARRRNRH